jgi:cyclic pyranopterin phosphate synthase
MAPSLPLLTDADPPLGGGLVDRFGRVHTKLRVSVTDRCNLRCRYCMPAEGIPLAPRDELLSFEEIERLVRVAVRLGVRQVRLTGGEPLVRRDLPDLVRRLAAIPGLDDLALSTNGVLLAEHAAALRDAGLRRVNVSLDALGPAAFAALTRRDDYYRVVEGIQAAERVGLGPLKINVVALRGVTEEQVVPFGRFARDTGREVRFIEYMPLDASHEWERDKVLFAADIRRALERAIAPLVPVADPTRSPATEYTFADGVGRIGFIPTVSEPFCAACDRFRVTADGQLRNCLFSINEFDARSLLRGGGTDDDLARLLRSAVMAKKAGHGVNTPTFVQPRRGMSAIGG